MGIWVSRVTAAAVLLLCLKGTSLIKANDHCDYSGVNLELVILQDAYYAFEEFIKRGAHFYPKFLESLNLNSLRLGAAIFGGKPQSERDEANECFGSLFTRTDDFKTNYAAFQDAMNKLHHMKDKWPGGYTVRSGDSASAIVHITTSEKYFSKAKENDKVIRILLVVGGVDPSVGPKDLGLEVLKLQILCALKDKDYYPSDHDVREALKNSGVTLLTFIDPTFGSAREQAWNSHLHDWGMLKDTGIHIDARGTGDAILQTLSNGFNSKICQVIKDTGWTPDTTTTLVPDIIPNFLPPDAATTDDKPPWYRRTRNIVIMACSGAGVTALILIIILIVTMVRARKRRGNIFDGKTVGGKVAEGKVAEGKAIEGLAVNRGAAFANRPVQRPLLTYDPRNNDHIREMCRRELNNSAVKLLR